MGILFIENYAYYFCVLSLVCEGVPILGTIVLVCGDAQGLLSLLSLLSLVVVVVVVVSLLFLVHVYLHIRIHMHTLIHVHIH